jgi:hypothetical protein
MTQVLFPEQSWVEMEGDECARAISDICRQLKDTDGNRRRLRWFECWSRYEGRNFIDHSMMGAWDPDSRYNVSRSGVDTGQAEIAARQRPKPMFLTSGGDWFTKRRAKRMDRFVEAWFHQSQGARYADIWELTEDCFRDAEIDVGGVVKVEINYAKERIDYQRIPAYEILVDPDEAATGDPQNWFHVYELSEKKTLAKYTKGSRSLADQDLVRKIHDSVRATRIALGTTGTASKVSRSVEIREAWFLPQSADEPGKHVVACEAGVLLEEDWEWPTPPLAIIVWSREAFGIWGTGMVQGAAGQHDKIQELAKNVDERFRLCAQLRTYYVPGAQKDEELKSNDAHVLIPVRSMADAPRDVTIQPITPAEEQHLETEIQRYFEIATGISQANASSRKETGVDSAIGLQTLDDQKGVRFMPKARGYEMLFVRLGDLTARAARDLVNAKGNVVARWPGSKYIQEIDSSDSLLDDHLYTVRVAPVSSMSRDPAQRLQIVEQLAGLGFLPKEKYLELLGMPDLDSVFDQESSESRWTERLVDRYLDASDADDLKKRGGFVEPDGYLMNPVGAMATVAQHYFDAMTNDAPQFNADLMRRFMSSLRRIIEKSMPQPAAEQPLGVPAAGPAEAAPGAMPIGPGEAPMPVAA